MATKAAGVSNLSAFGVATEVFLDPALLFGPFDTFPEFQELFPSGYRDHTEVHLLYKCFQKQRKLVQQQVKKKIHQQYLPPKDSPPSEKPAGPGGVLSLSDALSVLEAITQELEEELKRTKAESTSAEKEIQRICRDVSSKYSTTPSAPVDDKYFRDLQKARSLLT
ncbi:uncharacterized protein [Diadema setosum]|uniref:uncharacterized protein n=1 Tax=Diadema setosum TaxID=31175 RepID=UPI003B3A9319